MASYPLGRNAALWEDEHPEPLYTDSTNLNVMQRRLNTFTFWPVAAPEMRYDLAKDGFYYTGVRDVVKCYLCGGQLSGWGRRDNPTVRHRKMSPTCLMVSSPDNDSAANVPCYPDLQNDQPSANPTPFATSSSSDNSETPARTGNLEADGIAIRPKKRRENPEKRLKKEKQKQCLSAMKSARMLGYSEDEIAKALSYLTDKKVDITVNSLIDELHVVEDEIVKKDLEKMNLVPNQSESSGGSADDERSSSSEEEKMLKKQRIEKEKRHYQKMISSVICRVCHKSRADTLVLPCAHLMTCEACTKVLSRCFKCDKVIKGTKQVFYA